MNSVFLPATRTARRSCKPRIAVLLLVAAVGSCGAALAAYQGEGTELKAARQAIERREFAKALDLLAKSLKVSPENADLHFLVARTARRAGDFKSAQRHLDECVRLHGSADGIALERKLLQAHVGELDDVEKPLQALVKKSDPDTVLILEALSQGYIESYRLKDALECLNQWLKLRPKEVQAYLWRAKVWGMVPDMGDDEEDAPKGFADYREALDIDPDNDEARLHVAKAMLESSRPDDAREHLRLLEKRKFKKSEVLLGLARCHAMMGRLEEAEELFDKLLKDDARNRPALRERGRLAINAGQPADAEKWLRKAVTLDPFDHQSNYLLCQCLKQLGKTEEAEECLTKLRRIDEDHQRINELCRKVIEAPRDLAPRYELGLIYLRNNKESEGLRWLRSVLKVEPAHKPSHLALADYYSRTGKKDLAQKHRLLAGETEKGKKEPK
jgi:tetratricopeptide (TPR) repeat protein